jgi:hypothetical protein
MQELERYALFIYHISFAMNFYIYIVFGSKFRRELKRVFTKSKQNFSRFFREKKFFENDTQLELTEKNSTMTIEFTVDTNIDQTDTNQSSNQLLNYCYCCCQFRL